MQDLDFPQARYVNGLNSWMEDANPIIGDSARYLEKMLPSGESGVLERPASKGPVDLLSLNTEADSGIGRFLRYSWLKFFFIVSVTV